MKFNPDLEEKFIAPTYTRQPIAIVEGKGVKVKDDEGREYIDFVSGIAVCALGHSHPKISEVTCRQSGKLTHISNLYYIPSQVELAEKLSNITPKGINKFFFCNSGSEAVESAFKLAFKHTKRNKIIAFEGSFHGRTAAAVGATWKKTYRKSFKGLIPSIFEFAPFNDLEKVKDIIDKDTAAIIVEPIQGEGGINIPSRDFLSGLRKICNENNSLLIIDEVQTGMGRTGRWFGCENWDVQPDIITIAKALANGFPIGCMGARGRVMDSFSPGDHASTFGGNPLACEIGSNVIDIFDKDKILQNTSEIGKYFKKKLDELVERHDVCMEARGLGLMLALELKEDEFARKLLSRTREEGFLINVTSGNILRFVPPLIIKKKHIDELIKTINQLLEDEINE